MRPSSFRTLRVSDCAGHDRPKQTNGTDDLLERAREGERKTDGGRGLNEKMGSYCVPMEQCNVPNTLAAVATAKKPVAESSCLPNSAKKIRQKREERRRSSPG